MTDLVERFDPCATEACKRRCDNFGVCCEEICIDEIESLRQQLAECQKEAQQWFVRMQQENDSAIALEEQLAECQAREKASPRSNYEKGVFNPVFDSPPEHMAEELK